MHKKIEQIVQEHIEVPEDIRRLASMATMDLLWGPIGLDDDWEVENYQDFQSACKRISDWIDTLPGEMWVDVDCEFVMYSEPTSEEVDGEVVEPCWESIYYVQGRSDVVEMVLNHYLCGYV